jgi:predicted O-methyltransferase YrrM
MRNNLNAGVFNPTIIGKAQVRFVEELWPKVFDNEISLSNLGYHLGGSRFEEVLLMASIAKHLNPKYVFEVGTCQGRTTINIARNCPNLVRLFTLNLPPEDDLDSEWLPQDRFIYENSKDHIGINFRNTAYENKIEQIYANSQSYDFGKHAPIDIAFIDASSQCEYVIADSENCWKILRTGGVLIWHAYNYADGVTKGVDAFSQRKAVNVFNIYKTTLAVAFKE